MSNNAIQLWSPDTCECVIHLAYDDTLPPDQRTFTPVTEEEAEVIVGARRAKKEPGINPSRQPPAKLCAAHAALGHTKARHDQVCLENANKNRAFGKAQEVMDDLKYGEFRWSFDANRALQIRIDRAAGSQKVAIQQQLDALLGANNAKLI